MSKVTVKAASKCLEDLIRRASDGEEIIIVRGKTPIARLSALAPKRRFGAYRGEFEVPESFFDPLPEAELQAFEGGTAMSISALPRSIADNPRLSPRARVEVEGESAERLLEGFLVTGVIFHKI